MLMLIQWLSFRWRSMMIPFIGMHLLRIFRKVDFQVYQHWSTLSSPLAGLMLPMQITWGREGDIRLQEIRLVGFDTKTRWMMDGVPEWLKWVGSATTCYNRKHEVTHHTHALKSPNKNAVGKQWHNKYKAYLNNCDRTTLWMVQLTAKKTKHCMSQHEHI